MYRMRIRCLLCGVLLGILLCTSAHGQYTNTAPPITGTVSYSLTGETITLDTPAFQWSLPASASPAAGQTLYWDNPSTWGAVTDCLLELSGAVTVVDELLDPWGSVSVNLNGAVSFPSIPLSTSGPTQQTLSTPPVPVGVAWFGPIPVPLSASAEVTLNYDVTIGGAGTVNLDVVNQPIQLESLSIGPNATLLVNMNRAETLTSTNVTNSGTISSDSGALVLNGAVVSNTGLIQALNGGTLTLANATLVNTGGTIQALNGGTLQLNGGTFDITNGIQAQNNSLIQLTGGAYVRNTALTADGS